MSPKVVGFHYPDVAIKSENLGCKEYPCKKQNKCLSKNGKKTIKVLEEINLNIFKGEVVGIIGKNGSGKSTLLKIISKITSPTKGNISVNGTLASILELGIGFHHELTGRENIYLKGELYGFSKKKINQIIDEIIDYSELSEQIDMPVRTYSSGMVGRLAFSIMAHLDTDIFIVDEALSVGDINFSLKASNYFKKITKSGKTVIVVSHSLSILEEMCSRIIWLEDHKIKMDGSTKEVLQEYSKSCKINVSADVESIKSANNMNFEQKSDSLEYLINSADAGHIPAQKLLIKKYLEQKNIGAAIPYIQTLSSHNDAESKYLLAYLSGKFAGSYNVIDMIIKSFYSMSQHLPSEEFMFAKLLNMFEWDENYYQISKQWLNKSIAHGNPEAMYYQFKLCIGKKNFKIGIKWLIKSSSYGYIPAVYDLASMINEGTYFKQNKKVAFKKYLFCANAGHRESQFKVALMYRDAVGTEKNIKLAEYWMKVYSFSKIETEFLDLAEKLMHIDKENAMSMYKEACICHSSKAKIKLSRIYSNPCNQEYDPEYAYKLISSIENYWISESLELYIYYLKGIGCNINLESAKKNTQ